MKCHYIVRPQADVNGFLRLAPAHLCLTALGTSAGVATTKCPRPSLPGHVMSHPASSKGCKLRDKVEGDTFIVLASSTGRNGPSLTTCDSKEY